MDEEAFKNKKKYAGKKKTSMTRRNINNDYSGRHIYLITITTENRIPWFGDVKGDTCAIPDSPNYPHIELSPLGEAISKEWMGIPRYYPQINILRLQMMPDHLHGVLFVKEELPVHLGKVISGFKKGCNDIFKKLILHENTENDIQSKPKVTRERLLWQQGYNDRILYDKGQLQRWYDYLRDNPYRLLLKREHPDLFCVHQDLNYGPYTFSAIGNRFLLNRPYKLQLQCSRKLTAEQIETEKQHCLRAAEKGAVIVSPCISQGEKTIMRALFDRKYPLIFLQENGFTYLSKPSGASFMEACAEGRLLILAPWEHHNEKKTITRNQCLALNAFAAYIAST